MTRAFPSFLITIDTEGDNLWANPREITTRNARFLPRFQSLCERYGFKPTYLTNYEMAMDDFFVEFGRDAIGRGAAEIGMHLHAWNSPPVVPLTADDLTHHPYLIEYPDAMMEEKIAFMTDLLEDRFRVKMLSHRAGRWAFDERYARLLVKHGYRVDCSVTPGISWSKQSGAPGGIGGADYRQFPDFAYFLDLDDISRPGRSTLLELPMTITRSWLRKTLPGLYEWGWIGKIANRLDYKPQWLRPNGVNGETMLRVVREADWAGLPYVEFMLHSSEFMPAGSPTFRDDESIEKAYIDMECLFEEVSNVFAGTTLAEYAAKKELGA